MRALIDKYEWVEGEGDRYLAWTIAVISGRAADEVVRVYGGDPTSPVGHLTYDEAQVPDDGFLDYFYLQVLALDQHVVAIENNGWSGTLPEIARRASASGGAFFSVYWSPVASLLMQASDGVVSAYFDPVLYDPDDERFNVHPSWAEGVDFMGGPTSTHPVCMALMEQRTGVEFRREWLDLKLPTYRIPDPDEMLRDVPHARSARHR